MYIAVFVVFSAAFCAGGFFFGINYRKKKAESKIGSAEKEAKRLLDEALLVAEAKKNEIIFSGQNEIQKQRLSLEKEIFERRKEIGEREKSVRRKDETLDKKTEAFEKKKEEISKKEATLDEQTKDLEMLKKKQIEKLEKISTFTKEQAKNEILSVLESDLAHEKAVRILKTERSIKEEAKKKARNILSLAVQRCAADSVSESVISVVTLPNDEMKGRIIGREGRNIRSIETLTGVDLIVDDTPETITLSSFDPIRREVAKIALENLIQDGRIHPTKIEECVEKAQEQIEEITKQEGEKALIESNVTFMDPELVKLLGRLKYRTSYGQNVLVHSIEVAQLCGIMASELGASSATARRAGLLHDIGKALDHTMEGTHIDIGVDILKKYNEDEVIIHAVKVHHGDADYHTDISSIVKAADAISAARPGARKENIENYIKRLEKLENIATSYHGVSKCFAVQAGREVRVMVEPNKISDDEMIVLSRDIRKRIESELSYPGQVKVVLIRESRVVEFAR